MSENQKQRQIAPSNVLLWHQSRSIDFEPHVEELGATKEAEGMQSLEFGEKNFCFKVDQGSININQNKWVVGKEGIKIRFPH